MKKVRIVLTVFSIFLLIGCVGPRSLIYQSSSSGKTGCSPGEIVITELDEHGGFVNRSRDWVATCHGQSYRCSGVNNGKGGVTDVSCSPIKKKKK